MNYARTTERKQWAATLKTWWQWCNTPIITITLPSRIEAMLLVLYIELLAAATMLTYVATKVWGVN